MTRDAMLRRLEAHDRLWDMVIVGGGATGAGIAVDAASRGYDVLLVEQFDFGKGTSSRSTKLVHGGVRYLEQGNVSLVIEALKERGTLRQNAPHLVHDLAFIVPSYIWWESPFYGLGLKLYDQLSGKYRFGQTRRLSKEETLELLPTIRTEGLRGGVVYYDDQPGHDGGGAGRHHRQLRPSRRIDEGRGQLRERCHAGRSGVRS